MKLKEINRTAMLSWSPAQHYPIYLASGTSAQQLDTSFSTNASLEIFELNFADPSLDMKTCGTLSTSHRYHKLVWSPFGIDAPTLPSGVLIAGGENGKIFLYDPAKIVSGYDDVVIAESDRHTGPVRALDINSFQTNLVASGGNESEIYIWDLNNFGSPMTPGPKTQPLEDISCVAWNKQVQHILASCSPSGRTSVWDLRKNDLIIKVSDHSNRMHCSGMAWHPEVATQLVVASEDDRMPVIQMWDLRFASSPLKIFEKHTRGVLAIAWSCADPDLLLSCGKDCRILCWNPNTAEVIYELPTGNQWCFDIQWCLRNPAVFSAAGFDGYAKIYSIMGGTCPPQSQRNIDQISSSFSTMDPFGTGQTLPPLELHQPATPPSTVNPLKKPPKWIRTPAGASFAFGGKLVSLETRNPEQSKPVHVSQVVTETDFLKRSNQLQATLHSGQFVEFCQEKINLIDNDFEKTVWSFLKANFDSDSRTRFLELLGYSKEDLDQKISVALTEEPAEVDKPTPVADTSLLSAADTPEAVFDLISAAGLQPTTGTFVPRLETRDIQESGDSPVAAFDLIVAENMQPAAGLAIDSVPQVKSEGSLELNAEDLIAPFQTDSEENIDQPHDGFTNDHQWDGEEIALEEPTGSVDNILAPMQDVPIQDSSVEVCQGPSEETLQHPSIEVCQDPTSVVLQAEVGQCYPESFQDQDSEAPSLDALQDVGVERLPEETLKDQSIEAPPENVLNYPSVEAFSEEESHHRVEEAPAVDELQDHSVEAPSEESLQDPTVEASEDALQDHSVEASAVDKLQDPTVEAPAVDELQNSGVEAPLEESLQDPTVEAPAVDELQDSSVEAPLEESLQDPTVEAPEDALQDHSVEAPPEDGLQDHCAETLPKEILQDSRVEKDQPNEQCINGEEILKDTKNYASKVIVPEDNASLCISQDVDGLITQALLTGDFEGAVELCLHDSRMADAIILAIAGGTELLKKTQKKYFQKSQSKLNKLLSAVVMKDLREIIGSCELQNWKEALAAVMTYAQPQEFFLLCDSLGDRLEAANDAQLQAQACICYICAGNVEKLVSCWTKAQHNNNPLVLQDLVEKVVVMQHAVKQTQNSGPTASGVLLAKNMREYANLLASQGCLSIAISYLPDKTNEQLCERLIKALGQQDTPCHGLPSQEPSTTVKPNNPYSAPQPNTTPSAHLQYYQPARAASTVTSWSNQTPTALPHVPAPLSSGTTSDQSKVEPPNSVYGMSAAGTTASSTAPVMFSHQYQTFPQNNQCQQGARGLTGYQSHHYSSVAPPLAEPTAPPQPPGFLSQYSHPALSQSAYSPVLQSSQCPSHSSPSNPPLFSETSTSLPCPISPSSMASFQHSGPGSPGFYMQPPPQSRVSGPQNGWNDPPTLTRAPKKKQVLETYTPPAPITAPIMAPPGADPHISSDSPQFVSQIPQALQPPYSGPQLQQPHAPQVINSMNTAVPKTSPEGPPGAPTGDANQPLKHMPSEKMTKKPIPDEHVILKTTFEGLIQKCLAAANDPQTKRKLDDANKRMEALYDKLREQTLSPAIVGGLHNIARSINARSYTDGLHLHTHIVSSSNFSEISGFMPVLKVVLTQANRLGV